MNIDPEVMRKAALVASAALRDDDVSVRHVLHTLPPRIAAAVTEACVMALAELVRDHVPPNAIQAGIAEAQQIAQTAATERN
jgi:hypothetical protein